MTGLIITENKSKTNERKMKVAQCARVTVSLVRSTTAQHSVNTLLTSVKPWTVSS